MGPLDGRPKRKNAFQAFTEHTSDHRLIRCGRGPKSRWSNPGDGHPSHVSGRPTEYGPGRYSASRSGPDTPDDTVQTRRAIPRWNFQTLHNHAGLRAKEVAVRANKCFHAPVGSNFTLRP